MYIEYQKGRGIKAMAIIIRGEKYYLVSDLVKILPLTKNTIRAYIRHGKIRGRKLGKLFYVSNTDLRAFLDRRDTNIKSLNGEGNK